MFLLRQNYILIIIGLLLILPVGTEAVVNNASIKNGSTTSPAITIQAGYWISIDTFPNETYYTGDSFMVSGKTNLPVGREIIFGAYQSQFLPGTPDLLPPTRSGSAVVSGDMSGNRTWSFLINTTQFEKTLKNGTVIQTNAIPGDYTLSIGPTGKILYSFTLVERNTTIPTGTPEIDSGIPTRTPLQPHATSAPVPAFVVITAFSFCCLIVSRGKMH